MKTLLFKQRGYIAEENRFGLRSWAEMPSSIATTAAYLDKQGFDVTLRDNAVYDDAIFGDHEVAAAWISIADGLYEGLDYLRVAKRAGCTTVLVLFDDWAGMQEEILRDYPHVDYGIRRWDVEVTLARLLAWKRGDGEFDPRGIVERRDGVVIDHGEVIHHLDDLHHLGSARKWLEQLDPTSYQEFSIRVSSGCPFKCTFCHIRDRANRFRLVEDVLDELECVPPDSFVRVLSSDMLQNKDWCRAFAEGIIARGIRIRWETDSRFTWLKDLELLAILRKSGCYELAMGLESYHPEILKAIKKGYKLEQIDQGIENLLKVGIVPGLNMMIGNPGESLETLHATEGFLKRISPKDVKLIGIQYLRPLPGTPVANEITKLGMLPAPLSYRDFFKSRDEPVLPSQHLSIPEIVEWRKRLVEAYQS